MVAMLKKTWLPVVVHRSAGGGDLSNCDREEPFGSEPNRTVGILAFETGRTMHRLVSLHRCLSDTEINRLRSRVMRSDGVAYLNSSDQAFLVHVACAEMVGELDTAAESISRLAGRGRVSWQKGFSHVYAGIKSGLGDGDVGGSLGLGFTLKEVEPKMKKMEKYVAKTSSLHEEMEVLAELEASERKLERWKNFSGPLTENPPGADLLFKKLGLQRKLVRRAQEESVWGKSYDKMIELMTKATVTIFAKICTRFNSIVSDLPVVLSDRNGRFRFAPNHGRFSLGAFPNHASGPLERPMANRVMVGSSGPLVRQKAGSAGSYWVEKAMEPKANTLGSVGLALRCADVVELAGKMLGCPDKITEEARKELYHMLPQGVRRAVRTKLREAWKVDCAPPHDRRMAAGWSDAANGILEWLRPMATDTVKWYLDRTCQRKPFNPEERKVFALQTFLFADNEKTEAAVVELLVGLSCVCRYQIGRSLAEPDGPH